eukprot:m.346341 g.346341  ORF g.346341 m.346341 type:complete len:171 (-) comp28776_c0_seq1:2-514(-)
MILRMEHQCSSKQDDHTYESIQQQNTSNWAKYRKQLYMYTGLFLLMLSLTALFVIMFVSLYHDHANKTKSILHPIVEGFSAGCFYAVAIATMLPQIIKVYNADYMQGMRNHAETEMLEAGKAQNNKSNSLHLLRGTKLFDGGDFVIHASMAFFFIFGVLVASILSIEVPD